MFQTSPRVLAASGLLAVSVTTLAAGSRTAGVDEAANKRIAPVARVELAAPAAGATAGARSGEHIYKAVCGSCHEAGLAGAPKLGDNAAWAPRIKTGLDGMMKVAIAGKGGMPPRGASDANDTELARTIVYMANKSGGNLKEPKAK